MDKRIVKMIFLTVFLTLLCIAFVSTLPGRETEKQFLLTVDCEGQIVQYVAPSKNKEYEKEICAVYFKESQSE